MKTLIYDIEVSPSIAWVWATGKQVVNYNQLLDTGKIICIAYRYTDEPEGVVHSLHWDKKQSDKKMLKKFSKIIKQSDVIVGHNGDGFDKKWIQARLAYHNLPSILHSVTEDTLKQSRRSFKLPSYRLDFLCKYFNIAGKLSTTSTLWQDVVFKNDYESLKYMVEYCENDVIILDKLYKRMANYTTSKIQMYPYAVNNKSNRCRKCGGKHFIKYGYYTSNTRRLRCNDCGHVYPGKI